LWLTALVLVTPSLAAQGTAWTLASRPTLSITAFADTLPLARVAGATTLDDGTIAVGDEGLLRVLLFSRDGRPLASLGRRGGGPGEFQLLGWLGPCARDTVFVFDPAQNRITGVDARGRFAGSRPAMPLGPVGLPPAMGRSPYILACSRQGAQVLVSWPLQPPPSVPGPHRGTVNIAIAPAPGAPYRLLGTFPGPERYRFAKSDGPRPMGKTVSVALSEHRVFVGTADSFHVEVYDLQGNRQRSIHQRVPLKRFQPPDKAFLLEDALRRLATEQQKQRTREAMEEMEFPRFLPAYQRFLVDRTNQLWIEESHAALDTWRQWWAFAEDGTPRGSLRTPVQFDLYEIDATHALGKWTDEDGVESVRSYPLVRSR
jgi:hypothetical protein